MQNPDYVLLARYQGRGIQAPPVFLEGIREKFYAGV